MKAWYPALNAVFHALHLCLIGFVLSAWAFRPLRPAHLMLVLLTLGSWFILGRWCGSGYCPVSDWHWRLKRAAGESRPEGTYIHFLLQRVMGRRLDSAAVDRAVVLGTFVLLGLSLAGNGFDALAARDASQP